MPGLSSSLLVEVEVGLLLSLLLLVLLAVALGEPLVELLGTLLVDEEGAASAADVTVLAPAVGGERVEVKLLKALPVVVVIGVPMPVTEAVMLVHLPVDVPNGGELCDGALVEIVELDGREAVGDMLDEGWLDGVAPVPTDVSEDELVVVIDLADVKVLPVIIDEELVELAVPDVVVDVVLVVDVLLVVDVVTDNDVDDELVIVVDEEPVELGVTDVVVDVLLVIVVDLVTDVAEDHVDEDDVDDVVSVVSVANVVDEDKLVDVADEDELVVDDMAIDWSGHVKVQTSASRQVKWVSR